MKMAKASERDIDAAGELMSLLLQADRGDYPNLDKDAEVPDWFDEDNYEHLRAFYDAVKSTLDKAPGYPGRVIGGMCYVIMWDKNEIVDPDSDTLDLHPKIAQALAAAETAPLSADAAQEQVDKRDAERYRFLRGSATDIGNVIDKEFAPGMWEYRAGEELDAAIDEAMRTKAAGAEGEK